MKKEFSNANQLTCTFTDDGVTFGGVHQEVYFPYGSIDTIKISLLGVLQANRRTTVCSFAVDRKDRAAVKEMIAFARSAMKTAPKCEPRITEFSVNSENDLPDTMSDEEKLKEYKAMFVQGKITKNEYEARKKQMNK